MQCAANVQEPGAAAEVDGSKLSGIICGLYNSGGALPGAGASPMFRADVHVPNQYKAINCQVEAYSDCVLGAQVESMEGGLCLL